MNKIKDARQSSLIAEIAAEYFNIEANKSSLITITRSEMLDKGRRCNIYISVLPTEKEEDALEFAKRKRNDFRMFITNKKIFGFTPRFDFLLDLGERNRQRIDEISNQI